MKKRILSLLLALVMVLGLFPVSAMASDADTVYISVSYDGQYVDAANGDPAAYIPVSLSELQKLNLADYGLSDYDIGQTTALYLYIYAHEEIMGGSWDDVRVSGAAGSIFFEGGLFGFEDCNLQYYCNGEYPAVDGWGVTADQLVLKAGDFVDVAAYTSWSFYSDSAFGFHYFLDGETITHEYTATAGEALTVTLGRGASFMGTDGSTITKVGGYTVSYGTELGAAAGTVTTDSNGEAAITFAEAGTYYLWCDGGYGAENPLDIVSAPGYAEVTVEAAACSHETWNSATCTTPKTCADCGATEGEADPEAHSYVDGACEYCGTASTVIYTGSDWPIRNSYFIASLTLIGPAVDYMDGFHIYLNSKTAQDAIITINAAAGGRTPGNLGIKWNDGDTNTKTYTTNLTDGEATVKVYAYKASGSGASRDGTKTFYFHTAEPNEPPALAQGQAAAADETTTVGEPFRVDLDTVFADADGDDLSYQVKLDEGNWSNVEGSEYTFTPEFAGQYVLTFRAHDEYLYSEDTYTVNLTAKNTSTTYSVAVSGPENVQFYCTAGITSGIDSLGEQIEASYTDGVYTLSVPTNVSRISWRKGEMGMSAEVEADAELALIEASFKVMAGETVDNGALTVKYGDYTAVGSENSYLLLDGAVYAYAVTPADTRYRAYNESGKLPVSGENVIDLIVKHITVIAPGGSTVSSGKFYSYFRYDFNEAYQTKELDDGRISVDFPVPGSEAFIRVQHPDGVTYWDFGGLSDGTTVEVTEAMLFIGSEEFTKETLYPNYEKNSHDTADLYMTVNAQGWLDMDSGDVHGLNVFRNWIPTANSISNNGVSLPDVTYTVVDINGNASDVVEVVPDANNSCYADIKAVKAGTAIILVSYDAVYNADGEGGKQFSAIWPENTGVIVVTVDAEDADIQTNITVNEEANAGGKQILDVEHDILFYVDTSGAEYSFKPEDGCTVTVARSTVADEMRFNGFTNQGITVAEDGTVTISGLTTGTHIIKVEKDGKTAYQAIRAREVAYKMTHSDGTEVTDENPAQPGETVTVQFSRLIAPLGKLSGVYNANFGFYYNGEDGAEYRIASGYAYGDYYFGSNAVRQRFSATVPAEWDKTTYTLTDGGIKLGGFGGSFGAHRSTTYMTGKEVNTNASGTAGVASVLPDVVIPVYQEASALTWQEVMEKTRAYLTAQAENEAPIVGSTNGEWMVLGLARNGMDTDDDIFAGYYDNVVRFVEENYDSETGRLDKNQATVNARVILGLTSIGKDVTDVDGHDLLQGLSDTGFVKKQGINGPVWTLIALDSHDYEIPTNADSAKQVTREWLIDYILDSQLEGGGWKIQGQTADDMTPMAVQALAPYYNSNEAVKAAIDKALAIMEGMVENGSPETLAQIIVARSTLGLDSEEIVNKMLAFALEDGSFKKAPSAETANQMSTEQAFYAMVAYSRFLNEKTALYDMSDVTIEESAGQDKPVERITLSDSELSLKIGETYKITALVSPADAANRTVSWQSSDAKVASVDSDGVITAIAEGAVMITATAGEKSASCIVTVTEAGGSGPKLEFGLTEEEIIGYVTVSFGDSGVRKSEELSTIEPAFRSPLGTIIGATRVPFKKDDTIASVTLRLLREKGFSASYQGNEYSGFYLKAIGSFSAKGRYYSSFGEFDAGRDSGWMITWNGWFIDQGASAFKVKDGDSVSWQYTCQLGADIGDVDWSDNNSGSNRPGGSLANSPFIDVSTKDYYYDAVVWAVDEGITNGTSATTFSPNASCTRAQMVTFLWRAAGSPKAKITTCAFDDVDRNAYYYEALLWAVENGITNGTSATAFSPDDTCTRGQMATFLYRYAKAHVGNGTNSFTDVKADAYYYDAVIWAAAEGITVGTSATTFSPDEDCTRGQMVTFLYRYLAE